MLMPITVIAPSKRIKWLHLCKEDFFKPGAQGAKKSDERLDERPELLMERGEAIMICLHLFSRQVTDTLYRSGKCGRIRGEMR